MPSPPPDMSQCARCSGVALASRGYQDSGALMVRPSMRPTLSSRSVTVTVQSLISAVSYRSEEDIPSLQQVIAPRPRQLHHVTQFTRGKTVVSGKLAALQPEFRRRAAPLDMQMRRFRAIVADEVDTITADAK